MTFAEDLGPSVVGNDRFQPDNVDFLSVAAGRNLLTGFDTTGYTLINVRLFWIEGSTTPDDFLQSDLLPEVLPAGLVGRLALDFEQTDDPSIQVSVFFDDMTVSLSP